MADYHHSPGGGQRLWSRFFGYETPAKQQSLGRQDKALSLACTGHCSSEYSILRVKIAKHRAAEVGKGS
jgi:hypothetical protein